jgi:hypothetical protein
MDASVVMVNVLFTPPWKGNQYAADHEPEMPEHRVAARRARMTVRAQIYAR